MNIQSATVGKLDEEEKEKEISIEKETTDDSLVKENLNSTRADEVETGPIANENNTKTVPIPEIDNSESTPTVEVGNTKTTDTPKGDISIDELLKKNEMPLNEVDYNSLRLSATTSKKAINDYANERVDALLAQDSIVDEYIPKISDVSTDQKIVMSKILSLSENKEEDSKKLNTALAFSNLLDISMEESYSNLPLLIEMFGSKNWTKKNGIQKIMTSFQLGYKDVESSDLYRRLSYLNDELENTKDPTEIQRIVEEQEKVNEKIQGIAEYIQNNTDAIDDNMLTKWGSIIARMTPNMIEGITSANKYVLGTIGILAIGLGALPTSVVLGGTAIATLTSMQLAGTVATATGLAAAIGIASQTRDNTYGTYYGKLISQGIDHKTAKKYAEYLSSFVGGTEALIGGVGMQAVSSALGKQYTSRFMTNVMARLSLNNKLTGAMALIGSVADNGLSEGLTEGVQELAEIFSDSLIDEFEVNKTNDIGYALYDIGIDGLKQAGEAAAVGAVVGMVLGSPSAIPQAQMAISDFNTIKEIALETDSKKYAVSQMKTILPKLDTNILGDLYEKINKLDTTKKGKIETKDTIINGPKVDTSVKDEVIIPRSEPKNYSESPIVFMSNNERSISKDGITISETNLYDSNKEKIGKSKVEINNDTVTIKDLDVMTDEQVEYAVKEILVKYPNKTIVWDTYNNENFEQVKEKLISENPRGEEYGLSWYEVNDAEQTITREIKDKFNTSYEQASVMTTLVKLHAEVDGKTTSEWWKDSVISLNKTHNTNARGWITKVLQDNRLKGAIYAGKYADVSTFAHETFHLTINQMENKGELATAIKEWSKSDEFKEFYFDHQSLFGMGFDKVLDNAGKFDAKNNNWNTEQEEIAASIYEAWLLTGETKNEKLQSILSQISKWFREIYQSINSSVKIKDEISEYFDSLYAKQDLDAEITQEDTIKSDGREPISFSEIYNEDDSNTLFQLVNHGTAYDIDTFKKSAIGTGEGAQAYGMGFYFTQSEPVAKSYAKKTVKNRIAPKVFDNLIVTLDGKRVVSGDINYDKYIDYDAFDYDVVPIDEEAYNRDRALSELSKIKFTPSGKKIAKLPTSSIVSKYEDLKEEMEWEVKRELVETFDKYSKEGRFTMYGGYDFASKRDVKTVIERLIKGNNKNPLPSDYFIPPKVIDKMVEYLKDGTYDKLQSNLAELNLKPKRRLYKVEIPDEKYVQWNEPITDEFIDSFFENFNKNKQLVIMSEEDENFYRRRFNQFSETEGRTYGVFYRSFPSLLSYSMKSFENRDVQEAISDTLTRMGYVGVQMPVNNNTNPSKTKSNFVVFDENNIKIVGKTLFQKNTTDVSSEVSPTTLFKSLTSTNETDEMYLKAIEDGDMETVQAIVDQAISEAVAKGIEILKPDNDITGFEYHRGDPPKKTKKSYAVFVANENGIEAAFAGKDGITTIPLGIWLDAKEIEGITSTTKTFSNGTFKKYIPGTTGATAKDSGINPTDYGLPKGQKFLFFRPGKHSSSLPNFSQMNVKDEKTGKKQSAMPNNKIIFEIEIPIDVDLTDQMLEEAPKHPTTGKPMMRDAGLQRLPRVGDKEGSYDYKTNPNAKGIWRISSAFKINRLVPYSEIVEKNNEVGIEPPKWNGGYTPEKYGLTVESVNNESSRVKKLADPIAYDENGQIIPISERFNVDNKTLYQSNNNEELSRRKQREEDVKTAMFFPDFIAYKESYKYLNPGTHHGNVWFRHIFDEAQDLASKSDAQKLYKTVNKKDKNAIFKKSLSNNNIVISMITAIRQFKKDFEAIPERFEDTGAYYVKEEFLEDLGIIFEDNIINGTKVTQKDIDTIRAGLNNENFVSDYRVSFAKLFGLEYMLEDGEYTSVDYMSTDDFTEVLDQKSFIKETLNNAFNVEIRKKHKEETDKFLNNEKKLKTALAKKDREMVAKKAQLDKTRKDYRERIAEINRQNKEDKQEIRERYRHSIATRDERARQKSVKNRIKTNPDTSVHLNYADDMYAIQSLFFKNGAKHHKGLDGQPLSFEKIANIIERELGSSIANLYRKDNFQALKDIQEISDSNSNYQLYNPDDINLMYKLMKQLKEEGIERRLLDKTSHTIEINDIKSKLIEQTKKTHDLKERRKKKKQDIASNIPLIGGRLKNSEFKVPFSDTMFSNFFGIARKMEYLDGTLYGQDKGAFTEEVIDKYRELSSAEKLATDKRMTKLNKVLEENKVSLYDLTEEYKTFDFDGTTLKVSRGDLAYLFFAEQQAEETPDNLVAFINHHLMTQEEQLDPNINDVDFEEIADVRYKAVLKEANELMLDESMKNVFTEIYESFNGETFNKMNEILLRTKNKLATPVKKYMPIARNIGTDEKTTILEEFVGDFSGRNIPSNVSQVMMKSRHKIGARQGADFETNMYVLYENTVRKQEHLLAFYEYINNMNDVFENGVTKRSGESLKKLISVHFGDKAYNDIIKFIEDVANPYNNKINDGARDISKLIVGDVYPAFLAANPSTIVMQFITSPSAFIQKMNAFNYLGYFRKTMLHRKDIVNEVNELSPFMKDRSFLYGWAIAEESKRNKNARSKFDIEKGRLTEALMSGLQFADTTTVYAGWYGLYEKETARLEEEGIKSPEEIKKLSVKYADDFVRNTQPHSDTPEIAPLYKGNDWIKFLTRFTASMSPIFQTYTYDVASKFSQKKYSEAFGIFLGYSLAGAILFGVRGGYDDDDDKNDKLKKVIYSALSQPVSSIPLIGNVFDYTFENVITDESSGLYSSVGYPFIDKLTASLRKMTSDKDGSLVDGLALFMEALAIQQGLPISGGKIIKNSINDLVSGEPVNAVKKLVGNNNEE